MSAKSVGSLLAFPPAPAASVLLASERDAIYVSSLSSAAVAASQSLLGGPLANRWSNEVKTAVELLYHFPNNRLGPADARRGVLRDFSGLLWGRTPGRHCTPNARHRIPSAAAIWHPAACSAGCGSSTEVRGGGGTEMAAAGGRAETGVCHRGTSAPPPRRLSFARPLPVACASRPLFAPRATFRIAAASRQLRAARRADAFAPCAERRGGAATTRRPTDD